MNPLNPQAPSIPMPKPGSKAYQELAKSGLMGELQTEVPVEAAPLLIFFINNVKYIISVVVILLVAIVGYGSYQFYTAKVFKDAELSLGKILVIQDPNSRLSGLQAYLSTAPVNLRAGVQLELAALALTLDQKDLAAQTYGQLYTGDPKGSIGYIAALNQVDILRQLNKPTEALVTLNMLSATAPPSLLPVIQESIAACAEQLGDFKQALAMYEAMVAASPRQDTGYYQAKITELKAKTQN